MKRGLAILAILGIAVVAAVTAAVVDTVEQQLRSKGFAWNDRVFHGSSLVWTEVTGDGVHLDRLTILPGWPLQAHFGNLTLDPSQLKTPEAASQTSPVPASSKTKPSLPFAVHVADLDLAWEDKVILKDLNGQIYPHIQLANAGHQIEAEWNPAEPRHLHGRATSRISHSLGTADVDIAFDVGDFLQLSINSENLVAQHSFIADEPLPQVPLEMRLVWKPETEELAVDGSVGSIAWTAVGTTDLKTHNVQFRVPMTPLQSVVDLFGEQIPEAKDATIEGTVGLRTRIHGPPWEWTFEPSAKDLSVSGVLPDGFGGDRVQWSRNGKTLVTGPGMEGWVRLGKAGWLPEAAIAAEDIRFRSHPGFDLVAIQEALDAAVHEERMRGGSTITQQLAKNLFLDGRRTLLRKLRELLFALNMESRMSKDAILSLYLNVVEFGPNIHGIGDASNAWFIKNPAQLSAREAAFLTSILPAPHMWHKQISETNRPPIKRVNEVLNRMRIRGTLNVAEHRRSIQERLRVVPP